MRVRLAAAATALLLAACGPEPAPAPAPLPARLADTGLYAGSAREVIAPAVLAYAPQYPQWLDGAELRHWIRLPHGASIDATDPDRWQFPPGTRLWQQLRRPAGTETRFSEQLADGTWRFASYWAAAGAEDATLVPPAGAVHAGVPPRSDCAACHMASCSPVLGFTALQLSSDRDPLAPHAALANPATIEQLAARGILRGASAALLQRPPRIAARTPRERAVRGWLHANCSGCHHPAGALAGIGLDLSCRTGDEGPVLPTAIGAPSLLRPRSSANACDRITPGAPEQSLLWLRITTDNPALRMPPFGSRTPDLTAVDLIRSWIAEDLNPDATESIR